MHKLRYPIGYRDTDSAKKHLIDVYLILLLLEIPVVIWSYLAYSSTLTLLMSYDILIEYLSTPTFAY